MKVAFRVDASHTIGTGHFMRCLTLADGLNQSGAEVRFVCRPLPEQLRAMLVVRQHEVVTLPTSSDTESIDDLPHGQWRGTSQAADAHDTVRALSDGSWDWLVVDHYALDARWESALRGTAEHSLAIDDLADREHDCDLLLDQNLYADMDSRYRGKVPSRCQLLLGPRFALLRDEFRLWRERVGPRDGPVTRVLVCFGGVDADRHTSRAIEALKNLRATNVSVDVVIGAAHSDRTQIESACLALGFACHVQTTRMAELMAAADFAIGAGGLTTWERCCVGLPALIFAVAENQQRQVSDAAGEGLVYAPDVAAKRISSSVIGRHTRALMENAGLRHAISRRGMEAVDGRGTWRVIRHIGRSDIEIRQAGPDDSRQVFEWRNHPAIRSTSFNQDVIDWESHQEWFASMLSDPRRILLVGQRNGIPLGVVRFDIERDEAEVSIYMAPGPHVPGAGSQLLHLAERWLASSRPDVHRCLARVRGTNVPSHRLFAGSGYEVESMSYSKRVVPA